jgi:hypothetical protein
MATVAETQDHMEQVQAEQVQADSQAAQQVAATVVMAVKIALLELTTIGQVVAVAASITVMHHKRMVDLVDLAAERVEAAAQALKIMAAVVP